MSGRTMIQLRRYGRSILIFLLVVLIGSAAGFYILIQQRLPNPFTTFYHVNAAFPTAAAVVPGLGEPVDVAGVHVGEILGVELHGGQGIVQMEIDPSKGVPHLYRNASAVLTPNTPLKDMYIDIDPGTPSAGILPPNGTIPVSETTSPVDSDELLDELDVDTRDWLSSLITELANGTNGQGPNIRQLLESLGPTAEQTRTIAGLLADRRTEISDLVHNLSVLTSATSQDDKQLGQVVDAGNTTVQALATQDTALRSAISKLPESLAVTRSTLGNLTSFSDQLGPTADALIPVVNHLPTTLRQARTLIKGAAVLPLDKIHAFESAALPLATQLTSVDAGLKTAVPELTQSFKLLTYVTDEFAYDPGGANPGFLYWFGWFANNVNSFIGNSDANGPAWRSLILTSCSSLKSFSFGALLEDLLGSDLNCGPGS